jgi:hypothetical protein
MGEVALSTAGNGQLAAAPVGSLQDCYVEAQPAGRDRARQTRGPAAGYNQVCNISHYMNLAMLAEPMSPLELHENPLEPFCV